MTDLLEKAGKRTVTIGGKKVARNRFLANAIWQALTEAKITLPDGMGEMVVGSDDWWDAVQFLYKHVDGPPVQELDVTSGGEKIIVRLVKDTDGS